MWCCVTAWKGSVTLIIVNQTQLHCPTKKGKKWKKNLPLSFCCVSDATPDLRYNDWEENKTAWIRGTCTHFCCSQQKVKGGQAPHSILMPPIFHWAQESWHFSGHYWLSDHCYIYQGFRADRVLRKPIKLEQESFQSKSKKSWISRLVFLPPLSREYQKIWLRSVCDCK